MFHFFFSWINPKWIFASLLMFTVHSLMQSERCHLFPVVVKMLQIISTFPQVVKAEKANLPNAHHHFAQLFTVMFCATRYENDMPYVMKYFDLQNWINKCKSFTWWSTSEWHCLAMWRNKVHPGIYRTFHIQKEQDSKETVKEWPRILEDPCVALTIHICGSLGWWWDQIADKGGSSPHPDSFWVFMPHHHFLKQHM